ncbi:MAG: leucine-rich repeat domain-containing protein [Prevotella sp.]|nr:leucine-rich repeat domain-containing protein [Prevotella sp.]
MKKFAFRGLLFVLLLFCSAPAWAATNGDQNYDFKAGDIYYHITTTDESEPTVEVTYLYYDANLQYDNSDYEHINKEAYSGNIVIPSTVTDDDDAEHREGYTATYQTYTVTAIGTEAFSHCAGLTSVEIPNTVTSLGQYAFACCTGLTEVTIPESVTWFEPLPFESCTGLTTVYYNAIAATKYTAPVLENCNNLSTLYIGANVTICPHLLLYGNDNWNVITIYCYCETVPGNDFDYTEQSDPSLYYGIARFSNSSSTLYVPAGTETAYAEADEWKDFTIKTFHLLDVFAKDKEENETSYGYATFYNGEYPYTMPENLTGYSVVVDGSEAKTNDTYNSGEVVPANTALLLYGQLCEDCIAYVKYDDEGNINKDAGTATTGNQLHGSFADNVTADDMAASVNGDYLFYKFTYDSRDDETGIYTGMRFYWGAENGGPFAIEAKRAWLAVPVADNEAKKEAFYLDDFGTTGIRSVDSVKSESDAIYNLQGIRVNDMSQKGIYIVGGKKVIRK